MVDSGKSENQDDTRQKRALAISFDKFGGFERKNERLHLGWMVFSIVPCDMDAQLKRAVEEVASLKAQIARISVEAEGQVAQVMKELEALKAEQSRLSVENERLQALMERVSSGVR